MLSVHQRNRFAGAATAALALLAAGLPAVATAAAEPDLTRFYRQKVTWSACKGEGMSKDMQCGKVTVPLDYARPADGTLDVALARYRATGKPKGSVLLNFGGPGGSGITELAGRDKDFMSLTNGYDVVTFDPRGVGKSSPVSCGEGMYAAAESTDAAVDSADPQAALTAVRETADACAKNSGPVLPHIGTVNVSRDMDVMREALGDDKLNFLGFSYGSRLGAVYAAQFPTKTGRLVFDGVDTLTEPLSEQGLASAEGQQVALEDFLNWCTKDMACPFGQDPRRAREKVVQLVDSLDANPVPADFGEEFSGQSLVGAITQALYSKKFWPTLEQALNHLIEDGDPRHLTQLSGGASFPDATAAARQDGGLVDDEYIPVDNLPAALMAINCADDPDRPTAAQMAKDIDKLRASYEEASPVFGRFRLTQVLMCYGRPKGTDFIREEVRDVKTPKMLLVGTRGDPATPYRWTVETAERLGSSAVVLDNKGSGHTGYVSSKCVHKKIDDFLLYGSLPDNGSSCGRESDG
ncbi:MULTISPECIES: alpha/beta hydrolase [Streptomyces]|uniref:Alpha/beta hydrolase n=1 Tax=Streptomyces dengpaensis TaxID=2049881 RepID=A0ABM6T1D5_9ACTN|nr:MULTISPECIES: alpha/beta hydrolase [Streptomyces]AVH60490.1 alpha/beta hydrolase [Streptomyces dengpaensis]PIB07590.1 alpha/beta hydrolase [Streptomyces sp. HG99]